jgi:hypothetical protein
MSLTKAKIAALISEIKHGGDAPSKPKFHYTIIYAMAEVARNQIIDIAYKEMRKDGANSLPGEFYKAYKNVEVKEDCHTDSVSPMKEVSNTFNIMDAGDDSVFAGLDADSFYYPEVYIEDERLYLRNLPVGVSSLFIRMIPAIDDFKSDDIIPIPAVLEAEYITMISKLLDEEKETPQDNYNDSNAN